MDSSKLGRPNRKYRILTEIQSGTVLVLTSMILQKSHGSCLLEDCGSYTLVAPCLSQCALSCLVSSAGASIISVCWTSRLLCTFHDNTSTLYSYNRPTSNHYFNIAILYIAKHTTPKVPQHPSAKKPRPQHPTYQVPTKKEINVANPTEIKPRSEKTNTLGAREEA